MPAKASQVTFGPAPSKTQIVPLGRSAVFIPIVARFAAREHGSSRALIRRLSSRRLPPWKCNFAAVDTGIQDKRLS